MAAELPVVATDIRGVREVVVDGETGRLVPVGDPAALANAMRDFTSPDHQAAVARAGFERCRSVFDIADAAEAYLRLYRTVC
jgi:glycosyltransferase involved in cell wall biosynthesis